MSRGHYGQGKRARENEKARKKKEKAKRRREKRERGPEDIEVVPASEMTGDLPTIAEAMEAIEREADEPRAAASVPCRLFVGGLSRSTTVDDLYQVFGEFGPVADAIVMLDRDTGESRGFGFVTMSSRRDAMKVIDELDDRELHGRRIAVNIATERR